MFNGLMRRIARLPLVVLAGIALIILALPGVAGWFIADGVWDNGVAGAIVPYVLVALLFIFAGPIVFKTFRGSSHPHRLQAPRQPGLEGAQMGERTEVYHTAPGVSRFTIPRLALLAEEEE